MTRQQFIEEIARLSIADRIALIEAIMRSLREDLEIRDGKVPAAGGGTANSGELRTSESKGTLSQRLYGILKRDADAPSNEALRDERAAHLLEKYS